jgi:hypothetical protein
LATSKPPLSSSLKFSFLHIPREVPGRRWFGFLVIPGL